MLGNNQINKTGKFTTFQNSLEKLKNSGLCVF